MDKRKRIRSLFLDPADSYTLREVATLTDTPVRALRREVARGGRDAAKVAGRWRFAWRQAVYVALERWTLAEIHEALGTEAATVLPPLLALRAVTVRLPEYMLRALEAVAAQDRVTLDAALHGELIDFAGTMAGRMDGIAPGYREAYFFPSPSPTPAGQIRTLPACDSERDRDDFCSRGRVLLRRAEKNGAVALGTL